MSISKLTSRWSATALLSAAVIAASLSLSGTVRAVTPPENEGAGAGNEDSAAAAALELDAAEQDAPGRNGDETELKGLLAMAEFGSREMKESLAELDAAEADAAWKETEKEIEAPEKEEGVPAGLEKEAEQDEKEIEQVEKEDGADEAHGEDDKGDVIEQEDPGLDD